MKSACFVTFVTVFFAILGSKSNDFELNSIHFDFQWIPREQKGVLKSACLFTFVVLFSGSSRSKSNDFELNSMHFDFQWIPIEKCVY